MFKHTRKFSEQIRIGDEVWYNVLSCTVKIVNIRVDNFGIPIFDLQDYVERKFYVARFEEILEIY